FRPAAAMGEILDRGSLLFATLAAIAATLALQPPLPFYMPLLVLAIVYVPGLLFLGNLLGRLGSFGAVLPRDYSPLLTCIAMGCTAVQFPIVLARWTSPLAVTQIIGGLAYLYYAVLVFFAVRTVFGTGNGTSAAVVALSWIPLAVAVVLREPLSML